METESSLFCQIPQRDVYRNHISPRSFPALNSIISHKQLVHFFFESYISLLAFQSFLTLSFRNQVNIWSPRR